MLFFKGVLLLGRVKRQNKHTRSMPMYIMKWIEMNQLFNKKLNLQDTLIISHEHILLNRTGNSLQRLMRLTLLVIVLHILQRSKRRLDGEVEALVPRIGDRPAHGRAEDVGFSVLLLSEDSAIWLIMVCMYVLSRRS